MSPPPTRLARPPWVPVLVLVGVLAWLRIFATWFSQDDFRWLLRAASEPPPPLTAPRALSMSLYFRVLHAAAGLRPVAFHAVALALHLTCGLLLFRALAPRVPAGVAAAAAALFLSSPALFDALHWISAVADLLCGVFLAGAVALLVTGPATATRGWLAVAAYALALASKEIAVGAAPALALLHIRAGGRVGAARALASLALAALVALAASGAWATGSEGSYAWTPAAALRNLPAFAAAATLGGVAWSRPSDLEWARLAWVTFAGAGVLGAWLAALIAARSRPAWLGFAWFTGLLAPVVMLERQFYFYYLYCALPGLLASLAFLVAGRGRTVRTGAAWAAAALVVLQGVAIEARVTSRLELAPLPADFVLRRALIARNAIGDLEPARATLRPRVVMLGQQPVEAASGGASTTEPTDYRRDPWWDENVRAALADGDAIRLMFPAVGAVTFKPWLEPEDTASSIAAYRVDGHLTVSDYAAFVSEAGGPAPASLAERLARAGRYLRRRLFLEARRELVAAYQLAPDHPDVLLNLGALEAQLGDSSAALVVLTRAVQVAPADLDARFNLGLLEWRLGRQDQARATWDRLLREAPESDLAQRVRNLLSGNAR